MNNYSQLLIILVSLFLVVLISGFSFILVNQISANEEPQPFCGVVDDTSGFPTNHKGKVLFKVKCATCHNSNMRADMTGPALSGVLQRWDGDKTKLYSFIRNSQAYIANENDAYAITLFDEWNKSVMQSFPELTNEDIDSILDYIDKTNIYHN